MKLVALAMMTSLLLGQPTGPPTAGPDGAVAAGLLSDLSVSPDPFSPDLREPRVSEGVKDVTRIAFDLSQPAVVSIDVLRDDAVVRTLVDEFPADAGARSFDWNGLDDEFATVSDGTYVVRVRASTGAATDEAQATVGVDRTLPAALSFSGERAATRAGTLNLTLVVDEALAPNATLVLAQHGLANVSSPLERVGETLQYEGNVTVVEGGDGTAEIVVSATDLAGNPLDARTTIDVDATPPAAPDPAYAIIIMTEPGSQDELAGAAGAVEPNATVEVYADAPLTQLLATRAAAADGSFPGFLLGDNQRTDVHVRAVDDVGNAGPATHLMNDVSPALLTGVGASPERFSPEFEEPFLSQGVQDTTEVSFTTDETVDYSVRIETTNGDLVRLLVDGLTAQPGQTRLTWSGLDDDTAPAPEGAYVVRVTARDLAGNPTVATTSVHVDRTAPGGFALSVTPDPAPAGTLVITLDADEPLAAATARVTQAGAEPADVPLAATENGSFVGTYDVAPGHDGPATIDVDARDLAGNPAAASAAITVDASAPAAVSIVADGPLGSDGWYVGPVALTVLSDDAGAGIALEQWRALGGEWQGDNASATWTQTSGETTWQARAVDVAGNTNTSPALEIRIDTEPPTLDVVTPTDGATYGHGTLTLALAADGTGSALAALECRPSPDAAFSTCADGDALDLAPGEITFDVRATDEAGHVTTRRIAFIALGPTVSLHVTPADASVPAGSGDLTLDVAASDVNGRDTHVDPASGIVWSITPEGGAFSGHVLTPPTAAGAYVLRATLASNASVHGEATLVVTPGPLASLVVGDATGAPLAGILLVNDTIEARAWGFDAFGNALGPQEADWRSTGTLGPVDARATTLRFTAAPLGAEGTLVAAHPALDADAASGALAVRAGPLATLTLHADDAAVGPTLSLLVGQSVELHARGYDASGNPLGSVRVEWSATGTLPPLAPTEDDARILAPTRSGAGDVVAQSGRVEARVAVTVTAPAPPPPRASAPPPESPPSAPPATPVHARFVVSPPEARHVAGAPGPIVFTATSSDPRGRPVTYVASDVAWTIDEGGGTVASGVVTPSTRAGTYVLRIASTHDAAVFADARLVIEPAAPASLTLDLQASDAPGPATLPFSVALHDAYGNALPRLDALSLTVEPPALAAVEGDVLRVTGVQGEGRLVARAAALETAATFRVLAGPLARLAIEPGALTLPQDGDAKIAHLAFDASGNPVPVPSLDVHVEPEGALVVLPDRVISMRSGVATVTFTHPASGLATTLVVTVEEAPPAPQPLVRSSLPQPATPPAPTPQVPTLADESRFGVPAGGAALALLALVAVAWGRRRA